MHDSLRDPRAPLRARHSSCDGGCVQGRQGRISRQESVSLETNLEYVRKAGDVREPVDLLSYMRSSRVLL